MTRSTTIKLGGFALAVAMLFAGAFTIGRVVGPVETTSNDGMEAMPEAAAHEETPEARLPAGGLMVSEHGNTLKILTDTAVAGMERDFAFQILGPDGHPVTSFRPTHDKLMHLVIARRDLSGFRHVHPTMSPDGTWRIPLTFAEAGEYRAFADFEPDGSGHNVTLGADVSVSGDYRPRPLPAPSNTATVDGYTVTLHGQLTPGRLSPLTLSVSRDGRPVTDLQPYLAAYGHLIALRDGDLAYLHVHPDGAPGDGKTKPGPDVTFFAEVPSAGNYRLFLDFQHEGVVRTAEFTVQATGANPPPHAAPAPEAGHGEG